jgi:hypothetical protein
MVVLVSVMILQCTSRFSPTILTFYDHGFICGHYKYSSNFVIYSRDSFLHFRVLHIIIYVGVENTNDDAHDLILVG